MKNLKTKGFTLLEALLSVALIGALAGLSLPVYYGFQVRNDLDIAQNTVVQTLRRAQTLSRAVDGDTSWGVLVASGAITFFKGASYSDRDQAFDEIFDMPGSIAPSGLTEIIFIKFSGDPQGTGDIILSTANDIRKISINSKGAIGF